MQWCNNEKHVFVAGQKLNGIIKGQSHLTVCEMINPQHKNVLHTEYVYAIEIIYSIDFWPIDFINHFETYIVYYSTTMIDEVNLCVRYQQY